MFGLFKKKIDTSKMFEDGEWQVAQGEHDGNPIIVRFNSGLKEFVGKTDHTLKIGFAIPLNTPSSDDFPSPEENDQVAVIEDRIIAVLKGKGSAVQALAITMGSFKEFVYYTKADMDVKAAHEQLMAEVSSHEIQCFAEIENDWASYTNWANG